MTVLCRAAALIACLAAIIGTAAAQETGTGYASAWVRTQHGAVRLVSAVRGTGDGTHVTLGLQFSLDPGWKIYWRSPGDAGYPPRLDWTGSNNLATAHLAWPAPKRFSVLGFETIGYQGEMVLPIDVTLAQPGRPLDIEAVVDYLTCDEICVPYTARLSLLVRAGAALPSPLAPLIASFAARVPASVSAGGPAASLAIEQVRIAGEGEGAILRIAVFSAERLRAPDIFVEGGPELAFGAPRVDVDDDGHHAVLKVPIFGAAAGADPLHGQTLRLTLVDGGRAIEQEFPSQTIIAGGDTAAVSSAGAAPISFHILGIALLGGLILNLMPCVLPVLSIKLLSIAARGGQDRTQTRLGFVASAAGIVFSFAVLAAALSLVKLAGGTIGWGLQFQQPWFLAAMAVLVVLFACNLVGLFELALPQAIADAGARIGHVHGLGGQFLLGAFATLLATPCSAPFVGTALGFALSRGTADILVVFLALGFGLAAPYLVIAAVPALVTHLPRPGRWMLTLKRVLAAALVLTAVWLISLLAGVGGTRAAVAVGSVSALVPLALAVARRRQRTGRGFAAIAGAAIVLSIAGATFDQGTPEANVSGPWVAFEPERIPQLIAAGHIVYVNVSAQWCLTCKLNETAVLARSPVLDWLADPSVVAMRGDWTRPDASIAVYLAGFGRYGIPFDAVYGPSLQRGEALPELLTSTLVEDALARAGYNQPPSFSPPVARAP